MAIDIEFEEPTDKLETDLKGFEKKYTKVHSVISI